MDRKAQSKPMKEIISRLVAYGDFEVVLFGDEVSFFDRAHELRMICLLALVVMCPICR